MHLRCLTIGACVMLCAIRNNDEIKCIANNTLICLILQRSSYLCIHILVRMQLRYSIKDKCLAAFQRSYRFEYGDNCIGVLLTFPSDRLSSICPEVSFVQPSMHRS